MPKKPSKAAMERVVKSRKMAPQKSKTIKAPKPRSTRNA